MQRELEERIDALEMLLFHVLAYLEHRLPNVSVRDLRSGITSAMALAQSEGRDGRAADPRAAERMMALISMSLPPSRHARRVDPDKSDPVLRR